MVKKTLFLLVALEPLSDPMIVKTSSIFIQLESQPSFSPSSFTKGSFLLLLKGVLRYLSMSTATSERT